jgi:ABC-type polysaccharide/polyol phosphate export permease
MHAETGTEVYEAHTAERLGVLGALRLFARTLATYWPQIRLNMVQDWADTYRGSYLTLLWAVVMPIVPMSVFMVLSMLKIFVADDRYPAGVYIAAGVTIWMLFAETITITINAVRGLSHSLADAQTPLIVPLVSKYSMLFSDTAIRLLALLVWVLIEGVAFRWSMLAFPLLFVPMVAFSAGLGLILATFNIVLPDIDQLTGMILRYAVFFSYAFFPLPQEPWVTALNTWNIPAIFIVNIREILILGQCSQPGTFAVACGAGLIMFAVGIRTFFRLEPRIIERL